MTDSIDELVSPFDDARREPMPLAPRLDTLRRKRLTLLSIGKPKSAEFLEEMERVLIDEHGAEVRRASKPTFTRPAPAELIEALARDSDGVIEALAD
jgi:hypothetical protein